MDDEKMTKEVYRRAYEPYYKESLHSLTVYILVLLAAVVLFLIIAAVYNINVFICTIFIKAIFSLILQT